VSQWVTKTIRAATEGKEATVGPMDPLLAALSSYASPAELQQRILTLFKAERASGREEVGEGRGGVGG
jgi:hypothetical protein